MKQVTEWELSDKAWTLQDLLAAETIKRGPRTDGFAHAVYDLMRGRIDDPDISDTNILNLTTSEIGIISVRIAQRMVDNIRAAAAIDKMASMVDAAHKDATH